MLFARLLNGGWQRSGPPIVFPTGLRRHRLQKAQKHKNPAIQSDAGWTLDSMFANFVQKELTTIQYMSHDVFLLLVLFSAS